MFDVPQLYICSSANVGYLPKIVGEQNIVSDVSLAKVNNIFIKGNFKFICEFKFLMGVLFARAYSKILEKFNTAITHTRSLLGTYVKG